ncbi:helix-turn-helix domain-containing protein [Actinoallomurus iriomotensis]|uniref:Transcriptional regulator n=1 Tax=Actinoallomurus iriomotensis TaxID=478107 RepID=A0A9W6VPA2_9ACTN|nr:helix-turn-helix transcriptional regulator [Actinoallomurus iriomotensis]GLY79703.1 transcriptional regulator [Actinoallomurus iriomotensis]
MAVDGRDAAYEKRRRLANELRVLRDLSGISGRALAQRIGISQSKVSRIEAGSAQPSVTEVVAWARAVGASDEVERMLADLVEATRGGVETWQAALEGRPHVQDEVGRREEEALRTRIFQSAVVPGLLQTPAYAKRVFSMFKIYTPQTSVPAAVAARLDRQLVLHEDGRQFEFLIGEGALRWRPGSPSEAIAQLDRVAVLSTLDNVSIGLVPFSKADTPFSHGFSIYDDGGDDENALVLVENDHGWQTLRSANDVTVYEIRWSTLRKAAIFGDEARAFLGALCAEFRSNGD